MVMIGSMLQFIKRRFGLRPSRTLYALAVTEEGERLVQGTGFKLETRKADRRDEHNLYAISMT
jgi:hypothetical protein